ncbi:MAG: DnaJ domain-containing protein [Deltaproteobacteria bacterium]
MSALIVVLLAGLLLVLAGNWLNAARTPAHERVPGALGGWGLLGALLVGVVLLRFGLSWLALVGGAALAVLRGVGPLLRLWPLISDWQRAHVNSPGSTGSGSADAGSRAARPARMSRREALEVLGLDDGATPQDVQREYRRLVKRLHPDLGGSTYLTAKLNEARDVLS